MRHQIDEACVADELRKLLAQVDPNLLAVEALEGPIPRLLKENEDGQDLARMQPGGSSTAPLSRGQQFALPQRLKALPERIHRTK